MKRILAWHWLSNPAKLRDGTPVIVGAETVVEGAVTLCERGLHASRRLLDSLQYAPGPWLCRVACSDVVAERGEARKELRAAAAAAGAAASSWSRTNLLDERHGDGHGGFRLADIGRTSRPF